jgi:hypothetical protein
LAADNDPHGPEPSRTVVATAAFTGLRSDPAFGHIFANGAGNPADLDALYHRQMEEPLRKAGIEWEVRHWFRRGLATNLERISVRETTAAMILRHSNDRVTRKHYIKPFDRGGLRDAASFRYAHNDAKAPTAAQLLPGAQQEGTNPRDAEVAAVRKKTR